MNGDKKEKRKSHIATHIKTAVLAALFILMLILATAYIAGAQRLYSLEIDSTITDTMQIVKSGGGYSDKFDIGFVTPEFIGYRCGDTAHGILINSDMMNAIYNSFSGTIATFLGSGYKCENGQEYAVWKKCLNAGSYVYIRYKNEIAAPLLFAFTSEAERVDVSYLAGGDTVFIKELFIVKTAEGTALSDYTLVSRSADGSIAKFTPAESGGEEKYFDITALGAYDNNRDFISFDFFGAAAANGNTLSDTSPLSGDYIYTKALKAGNPLTELVSSKPWSTAVIGLFGYNPDRINSFTSESGDYEVFVAPHGNLRASDTGELSFVSVDKQSGIDLSGFLNYGSYSGEYGLFETVKAVCNMMTAIKKQSGAVLGGEAELTLGGVFYDGEKLDIVFDYSYESIPVILPDNKRAVTVSVVGSKITGVVINALDLQSSGETIKSLPQELFISYLKADGGKSGGELRLCYLVKPENGEITESTWIFNCKTPFYN